MRTLLISLLFGVFATTNLSYAGANQDPEEKKESTLAIKLRPEVNLDYLWLGKSNQNVEFMLFGSHFSLFQVGRLSFGGIGAGFGGSKFPEGTRNTEFLQFDPSMYLTVPVRYRLSKEAPIFLSVAYFRDLTKGRSGVLIGLSAQPWAVKPF